jgi:hypothetical protein
MEQLTGYELDRSFEAASQLLAVNEKCEILEPLLRAGLEALRDALRQEQAERRELARQ